MTYRLSLAFALLGCLLLGGVQDLSAMPSPTNVDTTALEADDVLPPQTRLAQAQAPQAPQTSDPAAASSAQAAADEPIGNVAKLTGTVTVIRNKNSLPLKLRDDIYFNDTVQTSTNATLGITFNDSTTFNLSANSKITIDNYVYEEGGGQNAATFDVAKGTVAFVAAAVAKTGDMKITTPTATLGIRGTTGLVEVPEGTAATSANNVAIKLYPDADGRVGQIEVNDRAGARLGALTQGASGFTIRPGIGGARFAAVPLAISRQEVLRDQGFVRQVHAAQTVGRQIVTEQRAFRRANPPQNNRGNQPNNRPGNRPGQQRPNGAPGQNRPGQPPQGAPNNRQGTPQQPGRPRQPNQTPQQNPQGQPSAPNRRGRQQQPGGAQQSGQPTRPSQTSPNQTSPNQTSPSQTSPSQTPPSQPPRQGTGQPGASQLQRPGFQRPQVPGRPAPQRLRPGAPKQERKRY